MLLMSTVVCVCVLLGELGNRAGKTVNETVPTSLEECSIEDMKASLEI